MLLTQQTLANIVTGDFRAASVFEKYQLDFCCQGKRTLADACLEKGLPTDEIVAALSFNERASQTAMPFTDMTAEQLIAYIVTNHHFYVKQTMPQLYAHLEKVALKHGDHFPEMIEVYHLFNTIMNEMTDHLRKEEMVLFPAIKAREAAYYNQGQAAKGEGFIARAIDVMEAEHNVAGELLQKIRTLTNNYQVPAGACTTFKVSVAELKAFEEDLHRHVHLENNILFPLAIRLDTAQVPG